jgi:aldehyde:ferredoxin oxidoreductase
MMAGYMGKTLYIDLSKAKVAKKPLNPQIARKFIGGRGLGVRILYDELRTGGISPYSPENTIIFATGPLTGTVAPSSGRYCVVTKVSVNWNLFRHTRRGPFRA